VGDSPGIAEPAIGLGRGLATDSHPSGVNYDYSPTLRFSAGYAYVETFINGEYPGAADFPENRAWAQVLHKFKFLELDWQQRLRLEQRWIGEMGKDASGEENSTHSLIWRSENRIRYMLRTDNPITDDKKTYIALWDELFFSFWRRRRRGSQFDQNRAFLGIRRKFATNYNAFGGGLHGTNHPASWRRDPGQQPHDFLLVDVQRALQARVTSPIIREAARASRSAG